MFVHNVMLYVSLQVVILPFTTILHLWCKLFRFVEQFIRISNITMKVIIDFFSIFCTFTTCTLLYYTLIVFITR